MKVESAKRAAKLLEEIDEISRYKSLLSNREHGNIAHFAFVQHYGTLNDYNIVRFGHGFNYLFIPIVDGIIKNLQDELESL